MVYPASRMASGDGRGGQVQDGQEGGGQAQGQELQRHLLHHHYLRGNLKGEGGESRWLPLLVHSYL